MKTFLIFSALISLDILSIYIMERKLEILELKEQMKSWLKGMQLMMEQKKFAMNRIIFLKWDQDLNVLHF